MMVGARVGAWANIGGGVPTARDYVQDGLVFQLDGIENAGYGVHDSNPSYWLDLVDGFHLLPNSASKMPKCNVDSFGPFRDESGVDIGYFNSKTRPQLVEEMVGSAVGAIECVWKDENITYNNGRLLDIFGNNYIQFNIDNFLGMSWGVSNYSKGLTIHDQSLSLCSDGFTINRYSRGYLKSSSTEPIASTTTSLFRFGYYVQAKLCSIRIYNKSLTADQVSVNYAIDKARFGLT